VREFNTIQERILDRALFLIGKKGSYDVPIRDITREAGVNVNAINYYFGSKDNMIDRMEEFFIKNYLAACSVLDEDMDDEEKLSIYANEIMEYTLQYPGIQIILRDNLKSGRNGIMRRFFAERAESFGEKVDRLLSAVFRVKEENLYQMRALFNSAILYPSGFGMDSDYDMSKIKDRDFRHQYIAFVIKVLKEGTVHYEI
jgi:AcrR family transcriptional regulator